MLFRSHYNGDPVVNGAERVPGKVDPVLYWVPSINPGNIAFYEGKPFAAWRGDLFMATMTRSLFRIPFDKKRQPGIPEKLLTELGQRLRDVRVGPDGFLYVLTDETAGALLRIAPAE